MKNRSMRVACMAALLVACSAVAQQTVYRWVDKDGKVHFSDAPPPADARSSTQKRLGDAGDDSALPYATQVAGRRNPVVLYTTGNCGEPCANGRQLLSRRGIPYNERNAASAAESERVKKLTGSLEVPVLQVGETAIKGYEEGQWSAALDTAGYPRSLPPGVRPSPPPPAVPAPPAAPTAPAPPVPDAKPR